MSRTHCRTVLVVFVFMLVALAGPPLARQHTALVAQNIDPCDANAITRENCKAGTPQSTWDLSAAENAINAAAAPAPIEGFTTEFSVNRRTTAADSGVPLVLFKVRSSDDFTLNIYRLGYYNGEGARLHASVRGTASTQATCESDATSGLVDCANWTSNASWDGMDQTGVSPVPAISGVYVAKAIRDDGAGANHIVFVLRDDNGAADLLFQTSDTTWQAYNRYGGNSLYVGAPAGRAYKVSYNRPFTTRWDAEEDWLFNAEYPMLRWLERNGYSVSYFTGVDSDRLGSFIQRHKVFLSVGHDEYWSAAQRQHVEAARDAGVNLAFFSGNEVFWKTRWEDAHRTLVCYKETKGDVDPLPAEWTGTWRDAGNAGGRPENALTGTLFMVNDGANGTASIVVPEAEGKLRLWRNTAAEALSENAALTLPFGTLGYEWDEDVLNAARPQGLIRLSSATYDVSSKLQDFGNSYAAGTATHNLTLYRAPRPSPDQAGALVFGAGTVQWPWGLDRNHARTHTVSEFATEYSDAQMLVMQQATVNLFADMGVAPGRIATGALAVGSADITGPAVTVDTTASFIVGQSVTIRGAAADSGSTLEGDRVRSGRVAGVEVSLDGGSTWRRADGREAWEFAWTPGSAGPITIRARAIDDSANIGAATSAVVTVAPRACPCTIWDPSTTPEVEADTDTAAVELGVKFTSEQDGFITGVRFYKSALNTGTHVGSLWSQGGTRLATAVFAASTTDGWQQVKFANAVPVSANTTYIASYHTSTGRYAVDGAYFDGRGVDNAPLHAPSSQAAGGNGVFRYGPSAFPNQTFNGSNYWVDVVFETTAPPDTVAPTVTSVSPVQSAIGISIDANLTAAFSEAMDPASITTASFHLHGPPTSAGASFQEIPVSVSYDGARITATLDPTAQLHYSSTYTAVVMGGASGVRDLAGNAMAANHTWSFSTAEEPPPMPTEGPGGPILVVSSPAAPFGRFYDEILRTEGLNAFTTATISELNATLLNAHDVLVLAETALTPSQVTTIEAWVNAGGNLIAMRPDKQLAGLLGLADAGGTLREGYLQVDTGSIPGRGIAGATLQYHGTADRYSLNGAAAIATLFSDANTTLPHPAVTLRTVGASGGQAAAFTFDLARSIVQTRQGNPAWSGQDRDGITPIRSNDLFFGGMFGDPQPDWVDLNKVGIPQADEQQRLLANLIHHMALDRKPLPRLWYLPFGKKAAVLMSGDDHANGGTAPRFLQHLADSAPGCEVGDWACVRSTSYVYPTTPLDNAEIGARVQQGFEVALHLNTGCADWTREELDDFYATQIAQFMAAFSNAGPPRTNRTHCIAWSDYATQPEIEHKYGIRLDTSFYYWPPSWIADRPGYFTGSAMPMRFARLDGTLIDVYQAVTQLTDESNQSYPATADALLAKALGPEGYYGILTANMHTDAATSVDSNHIIASAQRDGIPVVTALQVLKWLDARNASSFDDIQWSGNVLTFTIQPATSARGLMAMVPAITSAGRLTQITRGASAVPFTIDTIKGVQYAFIDAQAGAYTAAYTVDTTAPVISNVTAVASTNSAVLSWTTDEPSNARVDFGTSPTSLTQTATVAAFVTDHSVSLSPLAAGQVYFYRIRSADMGGNAAVTSGSFETPAVDATAPRLLTRTPASGASSVSVGTAVVMTFDEAIAAASVSEATVQLHNADGALVPSARTVTGNVVTLRPHALLATNTSYTVRIGGGIADVAGNPLGADVTWSFNTGSGIAFAAVPTGPLQTVSGFERGIILPALLAHDFISPSLPSPWSGAAWDANGTARIADEALVVDGAWSGPTDVYVPGRTLEFAAAFSATAPFQHVGLATDFSNSDWIIFSTFTGGGLWARVSSANGFVNVPLDPRWLGGVHRFRIDWLNGRAVFGIDGTTVATIDTNVPAAALRPIASDAASDQNVLRVDWLRLSPYVTSGRYTSEILDAGQVVRWMSANWTVDTPAATAVTVDVRFGSTAVPDGTWTPFTTVAAGAALNVTSRYAQYRATLSSADPAVTPALHKVVLMLTTAPPADVARVIAEDTPLLMILGPAVDANQQPLQYSVTQPTHGSVTLSGTTVTYEPHANYHGADSFTYTVTGVSGSATATVSLTIMPINDAPSLAVAGATQVAEGASFSLIATAPDVDGDAVTLTVAGAPAGATFSGGVFTWRPDFNQAGSYAVTFTASDGLETVSQTVTLIVSDVNRAPVLNPIGNKTVNENSLLAFTVSASDPDANSVTLSAGPLPEGAQFDATTGAFSWTPSYAQAGTVSVTFTATDNGSPVVTDSETVTITVRDVNRAPVLNAIGSKSVNENALLTFNVSATDADQDSVLLSADGLPAGATFFDGVFTWTPSYEQASAYTVTFTATDSGTPALSHSEVITITVNGVNRAPVLSAIGSKSVNENALLTFTVSATDADQDAVVLSADGLPAGATFVDGVFTWTPSYEQAATYTVTFTATDNGSPALSHSEVITITVNGVNRAPVLNAIGSKSVNENALLTFTVSATDADQDAVVLSATGLPAGATFVDGVFTWTPSYEQAATYTATFTATDSGTPALTHSEVVTITVNGVNREPVLNAIGSKSVNENALLTFTVSATDADQDAVVLSADGLPAGATFVDGVFAWTPSYEQAGAYTVTFTATDSGTPALSHSEVITITVNGVNRAPVLSAIGSKSVNENALLTFTVSATDADQDAVVLSADGLPAGATFVDGVFIWTPSYEQAGAYTVTFTATDNGSPALSHSEVITITVNGVNRAPLAVEDAATVAEDSIVNVAVLANDRDDDGDTLSVVAVSSSPNATLTINPDYTVTVAPVRDFNGALTFTYTASDGTATATGTVTVTVTAINDAPMARDDAFSLDEDGTLTIAGPGVLANDTDVEGAALTASLATAAAHGTVTLNADGSFTYAPAANYAGTDTFTYTARDGSESSAPATVTLTVRGVNDAPTLSALADQATPQGVTLGPLAITVGDQETAAAALTLTASSSNPQLVPTANIVFGGTGAARSVTITPAAGQSGTATITLVLSDGNGGQASRSFVLTVTPSNRAPVANPQAVSVTAESTVAILLTGSDPDNDGLTYNVVSNPQHGTLSGTGSNRTYAPAAGYTGPDSFSFVVNDGKVNSAPAVVSITVQPAVATTTALVSSAAGTTPTYGTSITLTATVTAASGTATGTVEFFDNGVSLGPANLSGTRAVLATNRIGAGVRTLTARFVPTGAFAGSTSAGVSQTVNKLTATSGQTTTPTSAQYSDVVTFDTTLLVGPEGTDFPAASATFKIGTQTMGTATFERISATQVRARLVAPLLEPTTPVSQLAPGLKTVSVTYNNVNANYAVTNRGGTMTIAREDATAVYTGPVAQDTGCATCATTVVRLTGRITDIADGARGDIRKATVQFVNRTTGALIGTATLSLENPADATTAIASYQWSVNLGTASSQSTTVGMIVTGYYNRNSTADNVIVTVTKR